MKKITFNLFALLFSVVFLHSQDLSKVKAEKYIETKGELTFTFKVKNHEDIERFTRELSIVNYVPETKTVKAWANEKQFRLFEEKGIAYNVPKEENEVDYNTIYDNPPIQERSSNQANTLTFPLANYPTYAQYAQQMQDFEDDNPGLVETFSIGSTGQGDKELLFVKISDNVGTDEKEPKLMLTSSMHGDEIAGYPMMLTLIDYILTVYANTSHPDHSRVKNLVENSEIWINPSANPDGTYHNSANNTSVVNARRGNGNNVDLNRNYPDNIAGPHDDGNPYQTETLAFMCLAEANNFVIAANFHGGTELVNYPFDNAYVSQHTHADGDWFEDISVEYATHAQNDSDIFGDTTYMTVDEDSNVYPSSGVTHGAEWYRVYGGRQDYMNFYQQCREITIELSDVKILQESQLVNYWEYNKNALLDFLTQGTYGFTGVVKDANTNNPIEAKITIVGHDAYGSEVFTDINQGDYYRPIQAGTYSIRFEAECYQTQTLTNQTIADYTTLTLPDVLMLPSGSPSTPTSMEVCNVGDTSAYVFWDSTGNVYDLRYRIVGASTWTVISNIYDSAYTLTGLLEDTDYEVQTRARCSSSSPTSYTNSQTFKTKGGYCPSNGNDTSDEYINRVQLNTIDNNNSGDGTNGYSNFKNLNTDLEIGSSYSITITPQWTGSTYSEGYSVWIDYNKDGDFDDAGEQVFTKAASTDVTAVGNFTIPSATLPATTTMRVSMKYNGIPTSCESFGYGEVEDYTVNLIVGTLNVNNFIADNIQVYPNPFNNSIAIQLPSGYENMVFNVLVYDLRGRIVYKNATENSNNNLLSVKDLSHLAKGTYLLKIENKASNISFIKKVVK
ncbi:M14 family zinc carboxypeptidase [Lacinutrix salivirga]